jgi:predicted nucleic acid-binding Zn ribbon protein
MATYIYETTDASKPVRRFEIQQGMKEAALTQHPETGESIRRVITGGLGYMAKSSGSGLNTEGMSFGSKASGGQASCGVGCGCH